MKQVLKDIQQQDPQDAQLLIELVKELRPRRFSKNKAQSGVELLIALLKTEPQLAASLKEYLLRLMEEKNFKRLLTDSGILSNEGFFRETSKKISHALLPQVYAERDVTSLLNHLFYKKKDHRWVNTIPDETWAELLQVLQFTETCYLETDNPLLNQLLNSILILSQRIATMGIEPELADKLPELEQFESPFLMQNREITLYVEGFMHAGFDRTTENADYKHILVMLGQCEEYIYTIRKNKTKFGASLSLTYLLQRLTQHIDRIKVLLELVDISEDDFAFQREAIFFKKMVRAENRKNSLREHFEGNIELLAFQITEHAGKTGEHYITNSKKEWLSMFRSASAGGFIVGFLTIFKVLIYYLKMAPFGQAFFYSMNYSFGFIGIHITHSTLATKQPAMTASKIASSLDIKGGSREQALNSLVQMIAQVSRSQFVAFVGNVLLAFPVAYGLSWLYQYLMGQPLAEEEKALHMLHELHPLESPALFHAGIAGVFLFLSGLISGYYDNKSIYNKIPQRIEQHWLLRKLMGQKLLSRFAAYMGDNMGSLAGNFFLGIFLGSIGTIGMFFGLPLDIRHITFSSGNFGLALASLNNQVSWQTLVTCILGIVGIGFMNFIVSFSLAIFVAIKSRKVNFKESRKLLVKLSEHLLLQPKDFFFPPKELKEEAEVLPQPTKKTKAA